VGDLGEVDIDNWDRILIINSFIIRLNKNVDRFIARALAPEKILVLVTSGGADWLPESDFKVDAFTSASKKTHTNALVHIITDWMDKDNNQKWAPGDYVLALSYFPRVDVKAACEAITSEQERYQALYPNLADLINRVGYQYLRLKDVQSALEIFKLNVSLFPRSWNVYDSYGEAFLTNGDRESAIRNYRKAVQLNPDSKSANDMLKKLCQD
jgi:tetratricopeptide (TPR) repeat protein